MKQLIGTVKKGSGVGKEIGFPTINVDCKEIDFSFGVYAALVHTDAGIFQGALHLGPRKVLNLMEPSLEVHLLDFSGDLYGQTVKIELLEKVRDTQDFTTLENLKLQIAEDIQKIREIFKAM